MTHLSILFSSSFHYETSCPIPLKRLNLGCERPFNSRQGMLRNLLLWCKKSRTLRFPNFKNTSVSCLKTSSCIPVGIWNQESLQVFSTFLSIKFQLLQPSFQFHFLNFNMLLFQCLMSVLGNQFQQPKRNNFRMINRWNIIGNIVLLIDLSRKSCSLANTFKTFATLTQTILIFQFSHF